MLSKKLSSAKSKSRTRCVVTGVKHLVKHGVIDHVGQSHIPEEMGHGIASMDVFTKFSLARAARCPVLRQLYSFLGNTRVAEQQSKVINACPPTRIQDGQRYLYSLLSRCVISHSLLESTSQERYIRSCFVIGSVIMERAGCYRPTRPTSRQKSCRHKASRRRYERTPISPCHRCGHRALSQESDQAYGSEEAREEKES